MWPNRSRLPASCRDLDYDHVIAALVAANVNISDAATQLHVPSSDLRRLMNAIPELLALAIEKEERRLDKAEAILDRELNSEDSRCATAAAVFVLRNAKRAVARGWRQPDVEVAANNTGPPVRYHFRWGDGRKVGEITYPAGAPQRLIEHDDPARARVVTDAELARERVGEGDHRMAHKPGE
jgi:hypothetical protein